MEALITRSAKLQPRIKRVKAVPSYATCYNFEAEASEVELGNLYVVIESLTASKQGQAVADLIIETVGDHYYNQDIKPNQPLLERFEAAVKATNLALKDYADHGNASWVGRLSAILGVVAGNQVHVTQAGSAEGYLYRGQIASHITEGLQSNGPHRPVTTFSNIASGTLQAHDRMLFSTPALLRQVNSIELKEIIGDSSPSGAVSKLSKLVEHQDDADRVAAIVVEATTTNDLAMQVRNDEPDEVMVGKADKPLEVAKALTGPAVDSLVSRSKDLSAQAAHHTRTKLIPKLRKGGLAGAAYIRQKLSTQMGRRVAAGAAIVLILAIGWTSFTNRQAQSFDKQITRYDQLYADYDKAQGLKSSDKPAARRLLVQTQTGLEELAKSSTLKQLDEKLSRRSHPENDPAQVKQLLSLVTSDLDQLDGITKISAVNAADLTKLTGTKPTLAQALGSKIILIDSSNGATATYDPSNRNLAAGAAAPDGLGKVVATTAASTGEGIYLLTAEPAVWLYSLADNSLAKQTASFGEWPKGRAIASYGGNIYILADDGSQVYKHVKTAGGFSGKSAYFTADTAATFTDSTTMTVDGAIYLAQKTSIKRFLQGNQDAAADNIPESLSQPNSLQSVADGALILTFASKTQRVGVFVAGETSLAYSKQLVFNGASNITSVTADSAGNTLYLIAGNQLLSAQIPR